MLYAIVATDIEQSLSLRQQFSDSHRARLRDLLEQGRLAIAGPCPQVDGVESSTAGFSGSVIIAEFASLDEAQQWANTDPFLIHGVYQQVSVKPFKQFLP